MRTLPLHSLLQNVRAWSWVQRKSSIFLTSLKILESRTLYTGRFLDTLASTGLSELFITGPPQKMSLAGLSPQKMARLAPPYFEKVLWRLGEGRFQILQHFQYLGGASQGRFNVFFLQISHLPANTYSGEAQLKKNHPV